MNGKIKTIFYTTLALAGLYFLAPDSAAIEKTANNTAKQTTGQTVEAGKPDLKPLSTRSKVLTSTSAESQSETLSDRPITTEESDKFIDSLANEQIKSYAQVDSAKPDSTKTGSTQTVPTITSPQILLKPDYRIIIEKLPGKPWGALHYTLEQILGSKDYACEAGNKLVDIQPLFYDTINAANKEFLDRIQKDVLTVIADSTAKYGFTTLDSADGCKGDITRIGDEFRVDLANAVDIFGINGVFRLEGLGKPDTKGAIQIVIDDEFILNLQKRIDSLDYRITELEKNDSNQNFFIRLNKERSEINTARIDVNQMNIQWLKEGAYDKNSFAIRGGLERERDGSYVPAAGLSLRLDKNGKYWLGFDIAGSSREDFKADSTVYSGGATIFERKDKQKMLRVVSVFEYRPGKIGLYMGPGIELVKNTSILDTQHRTEDMFGNSQWKPNVEKVYEQNSNDLLVKIGLALHLGHFDLYADQTYKKEDSKPVTSIKGGFSF